MNLKDYVREVKDFPKPGVVFIDIMPILQDRARFNTAIDQLKERVNIGSVDYVLGIEARGFILASALASSTYKGFIPIRKSGKLPPPISKIKYDLEYGKDCLEITPGNGGNVLIVDDVLATGGTMNAATQLCKFSGYNVVDRIVLINLKSMNQLNVKSVIEY